MIGNRNASAWELACRLFGRDGPIIESSLPDTERDALALLADLKAVRTHILDARFVLCPYCQLHRGQVVQGRTGLECQCPDCGPVSIDKPNTRSWKPDTDWLIRKLRTALDIPSQQAPLAVTTGIWRLGLHQRHPVILAHSLRSILLQPAILTRTGTRNTDPQWILTPRPFQDIFHDPFDGRAVWLPLEERFSLYGGNLTFLELDQTMEIADSNQPVHGPFSEDFRWVHLPNWSHGAIFLSEGQAAVFEALWHFKGLPQTAERIMGKAGLESSKPIDVFKVKAQNKGDPRYEGPMHAYKKLVETVQHAGTYALPCAASVTA